MNQSARKPASTNRLLENTAGTKGENPMDPKNYSRLAAAIFGIITLLQLIRVVLAWDITLNGRIRFNRSLELCVIKLRPVLLVAVMISRARATTW